MDDFGHTDCIDCGAYSPRLLPRKFPHICHACLFPPPPKPDALPSDGPSEMPRPSMIEALHERASKARGGFMRSEFGVGEWS